MVHVTITEGEDASARAALIALKGILPDDRPIPRDRVRIGGETTLLTDAEAAARLSMLPKPVYCEPRLGEGVLELVCEPVSNDDEHVLRAQRSAIEVGDLFSASEYSRMRATGNDRVLVVGREEFILVTRADYERMWFDYMLVGYFCVPRDVEHFGDRSVDAITAREFFPCTSPMTVSVKHG